MNKSNQPHQPRYRYGRVTWLLAGLFASTLYWQPVQAETLDQIAAIVNKDVILQSEVSQRMQFLQASDRTAAKLSAPALQKRATDELIVERLQVQYAKEKGIQIDDETLNRTLERVARNNKMDLATFQRALQAEGLSYSVFREQTRRKLLADALRRQQAGSKVNITEQEVADLIGNQSDKLTAGVEYRLGQILIAAPNGSSVEQVNNARKRAEAVRRQLNQGADFNQLAQQFSASQNAGSANWQSAESLPPAFKRELALMKPGDLSRVVRDPNGFSILKLLDQQGGQQNTLVAETRVRHILLSRDKYSAQQARETLDTLSQQLREGADFATLAREYSDDPGSKNRGGDLGWAKPGQMVEPFEQAMNTQPPNTIGEPVETQFGWHIIQVLDRKQVVQTSDQLKAKASNYLGTRKEEEQYQRWLQSLRNSAYIEYRVPGTEPGLKLQ